MRRPSRKITVLTLTCFAAWPLGCPQQAAREDADAQESDTQDVDAQESDTQDVDAQESDTQDVDAQESDTEESEDIAPTLDEAASCDDVEAVLKGRLVTPMQARLQDNLKRAMEATQYSCEEYDGEEEEEEEEEEEDGGASEFSGTNLQEADVDEADFVKNDGNYLYVLADDRFQVLDAWPAAEAHPLSSYPVKGTPRRMYVHAGTAVIYSSLDEVDQPSPDDPYHDACTYGYDCDFTGDGLKLQITVLDLADRANPRLTRELVFNGSYLNSRRVGMDVHTAVVLPELDLPNLVYWPDELPVTKCGLVDKGFSQLDVQVLFAQLLIDNLKHIQDTPVSELLPTVRDTSYIGGEAQMTEDLLSPCDDVYLARTGDMRGFVSLVSFAIGEQAPVGASTIMSRPGAMYGTKDSLYLAVRHRRDPYEPWFSELYDVYDATSVHKFALNPGGAASDYAASGVVKGRILNQFAMDEHRGVLRLATTTFHIPNPSVHSTITTLMEHGSRLVELGRIDQIAPTEDIRSVRFRGDVGFVVTFKKTDPLFVLDLADPGAPSIKGELKIPGYSTYMHLMGEDHLLTMGYDAEEQGDFAYFQGLQLQVIDVSELTNPLLIHKEVIGTRGSTSDAATNHLAFTYFKERDLLAVPMTICEGSGGGGDYGDLMTFSGLLVYRVTVDGGFDLLGGVPHEEPETQNTGSGKCDNWWTESASRVKRSVFMEDWVFSIASDRVNVAHLDDLAHPAASIQLLKP